MITLAIDASTYTGTVAIARGGDVVVSAVAAMRGTAEEHLMPAVASAVTAAGLTPRAIERVVCGAGPGSFTSLRIAASIAKGLAVGLERPLFAVSSLALLVASAGDALAPGTYLAALDALRGEWYAAEYVVARDGSIAARDGELHLVPADGLVPLARQLDARLTGPGLELDVQPHAAGVVRLEPMLRKDGPVDLASWQPDYGRKAEAQVRWEAAHGRPLPHT